MALYEIGIDSAQSFVVNVEAGSAEEMVTKLTAALSRATGGAPSIYDLKLTGTGAGKRWMAGLTFGPTGQPNEAEAATVVFVAAEAGNPAEVQLLLQNAIDAISAEQSQLGKTEVAGAGVGTDFMQVALTHQVGG